MLSEFFRFAINVLTLVYPECSLPWPSSAVIKPTYIRIIPSQNILL